MYLCMTAAQALSDTPRSGDPLILSSHHPSSYGPPLLKKTERWPGWEPGYESTTGGVFEESQRGMALGHLMSELPFVSRAFVLPCTRSQARLVPYGFPLERFRPKEGSLHLGTSTFSCGCSTFAKAPLSPRSAAAIKFLKVKSFAERSRWSRPA